MRNFFIFLFVFSSLLTDLSAQKWMKAYVAQKGRSKSDFNYYDIRQWADTYFKQTDSKMQQLQAQGKMISEFDSEEFASYIKYKRWEWFWRYRVTADGTPGMPSYTDIKTLQLNKSKKKGYSWTSIAFNSNSGGYWGMGRAECMGIHPTNANIFYVGSQGGGLWKTIDGGASYTSIGDDLPITQVAEIVVHPTTPDIVYIALGPRGGWWQKSVGVYKSTDGGATFSPTGLINNYADGQPIEDMVMSETNANVLLLARGDGIYRTADAGVTWSKVYATNCNDLAWKPGDANVVYGTKSDYWGSCEVIKSSDGGITWTQITSMNIAQNSLKIAVTPANPNLIAYYSSAENKALYVSTNNGQSFTKRSTMEHDMWPLFISHTDANKMYNGGISVARSTDGGYNWTKITEWYGGTSLPEVHADVRNVYASRNQANIIYFCNDGGVYKYNESTNVWTELTNGLVITQYYRGAVAQTNATVVIAGSQDNGGSRRESNGIWHNTNGGDAMEQAIDPNNANIMYTTYCNGQLYRSDDGWNWDTYRDISANIPGGKPSGDWVTPYQLDPNNSSVIVAGYDDVWRSTNKGTSWTKISTSLANGNTIQQVAIAPSNSNVIYCSQYNKIYVTTNLGGSWTSYSIPVTETISRIAVHPTDASKLWITVGGWSAGNKVYVSTNGGQSWTNISGTLPNVPTNCIISETGSNEGLYVGNDFGVYYKNNTLSDWVAYSDGLPNTIVNDLDIQFSSKKIRAATWGRGMWEAPIYDPAQVVVNDCHGDPNGTATIDQCGVCSGGNTGLTPNASCCNPGGTVTVEQWNTIAGNYISAIPLTTEADETYTLSSLDKSLDGLDEVGTRIRALICPPVTGTYTFWISSDDEGQLWLSTDEKEQNKQKIAYVAGWTNYKAYDANTSQQSAGIVLTAGKQYYIEMLHKEGSGGAHYSVAWQIPGQVRNEISASYLSAYNPVVAPTPINGTGTGLLAAYYGMNNLTDLQHVQIDTAIAFTWGAGAPVQNVQADSFSVRWTGMIQPRYDGEYTFYINSDNGRRLWINDQLIIDKWIDDWNVTYSGKITLVAGQLYPIKIEYFENYGGAEIQLEWESTYETRQLIQSQQLYPNDHSTQYPYTLTPHSIPGTIEAEDYDWGGDQASYSDSDVINNGDAYRNDDVDIEICTEDQNGFNVGWTAANEWLEYTIDVTATASYQVLLRTASIYADGIIRLTIDGITVADSIIIPATGNWQAFTDVITTLQLTEGIHILGIHFDAGDINLNRIIFAEDISTTISKSGANSFSIYPNPARDQLIIKNEKLKMNNGEEYTISIHNTLGQEFYNSSFFILHSSLNIDVSSFAPGLYFIKLGNEVKTFIINK